jgi:hypothetical protein
MGRVCSENNIFAENTGNRTSVKNICYISVTFEIVLGNSRKIIAHMSKIQNICTDSGINKAVFCRSLQDFH